MNVQNHYSKDQDIHNLKYKNYLSLSTVVLNNRDQQGNVWLL